ncbi:MAG: class I SAM-dependent methyltransferase [Mycobacteriales bacterium]
MTLREHALRAVRTSRAVVADVQHPPFVRPGHYYSPMTSKPDVDHAIASRRPPAGVDLREDQQVALARELALSEPPRHRWQPHNGMFDTADASMLRALLLRHRPRRFFEVGSGFSTAVALDVAEQSLPELQVTCVEPYADRLRSRLRPMDSTRLTLLEQPVQSREPRFLASQVGSGDIFFIDSTHVVKPGSDVVWLILHTLPLLPVGVLVHVHDVFWPFEYPDGWLREGRDWTEAYLLHAFLSHNHAWQIELNGSWLWQHDKSLFPATATSPPGSLWLRRVSDDASATR